MTKKINRVDRNNKIRLSVPNDHIHWLIRRNVSLHRKNQNKNSDPVNDATENVEEEGIDKIYLLNKIKKFTFNRAKSTIKQPNDPIKENTQDDFTSDLPETVDKSKESKDQKNNDFDESIYSKRKKSSDKDKTGTVDNNRIRYINRNNTFPDNHDINYSSDVMNLSDIAHLNPAVFSSNNTETSKDIPKILTQFFDKIVDNIKNKFTEGSSLIYVAAGSIVLILIIVIPLITTMIYSNSTTSISGILPLSDEVLAYEDMITHYASKYGIEDYVPILEGIMMVESEGSGNDPMDSSGFEYNVKYVTGITDPEYSVDVGIHYFKLCLDQAETESIYDTDHLYLAIQSYDYGCDYIDWVNNNFNGYSEANAKIYEESILKNDKYDSCYVSHVLQYVSLGIGNIRFDPDFTNSDAWITKNPYAKNYMGQCTWFAWARFYEIYGYDPGFYGSGSVCVEQLVSAHPDLFVKSTVPAAGAIFSGIGHNHVGIVLAYDGVNVTIQEGNLDGKNNDFKNAQTDWHTVVTTLEGLNGTYGGVVFAVPIN